jgi:sugar lactone lactonase YvrE
MDRPNQVLALAQASQITASASSQRFAAVAGSGVSGSLGDGGAATSAELSLELDSPDMRSGIAIAADGTIFIADTRNATIRRISSAAASDAGVIRSVAGKWAPPQNVKLVEPMGLALDRSGNLYIADHGANAVIELHDAIGATPGRLEILAHVAHAADLAIIPDGSRIFVSAPESDSVLSLDIRTRAITQVLSGGKARVLSGAQQSSTNAGAGARVCMSIDSGEQPCPWGIAVDGGGNLFVADPTGNVIRRVDAATQQVTNAVDQVVTAAGAMAFDANGNLFVAEQGRNRLLEIKGLGQPVSNVTLTPPPAPVPPAGVPCPAIAPPLGFTSNTNFCAEPVSGTTPTAAFTVTNNTNAALTNLSWTTIGINPSDFVVVSTSCTPTLNANSSCSLNVGFAPTATGTRSATLAVTFAGAGNPLASALAGTGEDYQITLASGQLTEISVLAGSKGTFNLQLVPDNIFTGTVNFVCPGNMPAATTCSFSPGNSVTVTTPGTAVPFSVAFQTTSRTPTKNLIYRVPGAGASGRVRPATIFGDSFQRAMAFSAALSALIMIAAFLFTSSARRRRHYFLRVAMLVLLLSVAAILEGCHHYGSTGTTGTPVGSSTMIVQGTTQGAARGITVTLDVE